MSNWSRRRCRLRWPSRSTAPSPSPSTQGSSIFSTRRAEFVSAREQGGTSSATRSTPGRSPGPVPSIGYLGIGISDVVRIFPYFGPWTHLFLVSPSKQLFSQKLPNVPGKTVTVVQRDYRPGGFSAPHRHPASGFVFAYVVLGTIRSQIEGEPLGVYRAGQSWTEGPNSHHTVSANASKTEAARLIAYIIADDGVQATVYDK